MNETLELPGVPPIPKKRGRPSTGKALTAAQRKRKQRQAGIALHSKTAQELREVPLTLLLEEFQRSFSCGLKRSGVVIGQELLRRANLIEKRDSHTKES